MTFSSPANLESAPFERDRNRFDPEKLLKRKQVKARMTDFSGFSHDDKPFIINNIIESWRQEEGGEKRGPQNAG